MLFSSSTVFDFPFKEGNIIIVVLILNSRIFSSSKSSSSSTTDVYYDEYIKSRVSTQTQRPQDPNFEVIKPTRVLEEHGAEFVDMGREKVQEKEEESEASLVCDSDELSKRADAFIARVNKQRKLELSLLHYETEY
ncbi:11-beta-hydroxysteroid dehydrogenase 1B-like isoform X1 [Senna tora]|uniref:11-beta-hydroxysteroid dehydrogenase 1B-like isoform X1 n=1 Tax=Senna tora TaxID=362788 RepID=A0A834WWX8_9FABA|nr:11-beta-hydroxysteroid dehydrogenase 1B-like isoform X1 [Senna tora]